jgi:alpha-galactosidase
MDIEMEEKSMFETIIRKPDFAAVKSSGREFTGEGAVAEADILVETLVEGDSLKVYVTADTTPLELVRLRWNFKNPLQGRILGDAWERGYGDMRWEGLVPYRAMPWYFLLHKEEETAGYGVMVRPAALCFWQADPKGVSLWLDVRNGGEGVLLGGRKLLAAEVVQEVYTGINAFHAAQEFCGRMCKDPIFPPKPVYGANNWYYAYGHSSEGEILSDAAYLADLTKGLENRPYMVIDDCWQKYRSDEYIGGPWVSNEKFPDMKALADKLVEMGTIPGIWVRFLLDRSETIPQKWRLSHNGALDPSHPEVIARIKEDITRICGWGYRLIKHDFSTFDIFGKWGFQMLPLMTENGWHFYDRSRTSAEIVTNLYREILDSASPTGTLILGCNTIGHLGAGLMHMNRTGDDTSGLLWERTMRLGVNTLAFRMPQHGKFYDVDADCLGVTEGIPWKYNKLWGELLAKSGTSLFVSVKPGVLSEEENAQLAEYMNLGSLQEHIAEPLDWEENMLPQYWKSGEEERYFDWFEDQGLRICRETGAVWERQDSNSVF